MPVPPQTHAAHEGFLRDMRASPSGAGLGQQGGGAQSSQPAPIAGAGAAPHHRGAAGAAASSPSLPPLPVIPPQLSGAQLRLGAVVARNGGHSDDSDMAYLEAAGDAIPRVPFPRPHRPQDFLAYKLTVMSYTCTSTAYSAYPVDVSPDSAPCYVLTACGDHGYDLLRVLDCHQNFNRKDPQRLLDKWGESPPWPVVLRVASPEEVAAYCNEHAKARQALDSFMRKAVDAKKILVTAVELRFDGREITVVFDDPLEAERNKQRLDANILRQAEETLSTHLKVHVHMRRAQEDPPPSALASAAALPRHQRPTFLPPFRDPSTNNMITFEYNPVNGLRYWVNDSERPPLQSINTHASNGTLSLLFQDQERGITLPHSCASKIVAELTKLANLASIRHDLPGPTGHSLGAAGPPGAQPPAGGGKGVAAQPPPPQPQPQQQQQQQQQQLLPHHPLGWGQAPPHQHHQMGMYGGASPAGHPAHPHQQPPPQTHASVAQPGMLPRFGAQQPPSGTPSATPPPGAQGAFGAQLGPVPQGQAGFGHSAFGAPPRGMLQANAAGHPGYPPASGAPSAGGDMSAAPAPSPQGGSMPIGGNGNQPKHVMLMPHAAPNPQAHPFMPSGQGAYVYAGAHGIGGASGSGSESGRKTPDSLGGGRGVPAGVTFDGAAQAASSGVESPQRRPTPPPESGGQSPVMIDGKVQQPCHYFQSGGCSRGDRCRYLHVYPSEQPTNVHIPERMKDAVRRAISFTSDEKQKKARPEPEPVVATTSAMDKIQIDLDSHAGQLEWLIMNSTSQDPSTFYQTVHEFQIIEDEARTTILHSEEAEWHRREGTIMEVANKLKDMLMRHELVCLQIAAEESGARDEVVAEEGQAWGMVEEGVADVPGEGAARDPPAAVAVAAPAAPVPPVPTGWYVGAQGGYVRSPGEAPEQPPPEGLPQLLQKQQHFVSMGYRPPPPLIPSSMLSYYRQDDDAAAAREGDEGQGWSAGSPSPGNTQEVRPFFKAVNPEEAQLQAAAARASRSAEQRVPPAASKPAAPGQASPSANAGGKTTRASAARAPQPKAAAPTAAAAARRGAQPTAQQARLQTVNDLKDTTQFPELSSAPPPKQPTSQQPVVFQRESQDASLVWKDKGQRGGKAQSAAQSSSGKKRGGVKDKTAEAAAKMKMEKARKKLEENLAGKQGVY